MNHPVFDPAYSTTAMSEAWSTASRIAAILEFESALALSLAEIGMAPPGEAQAVADACRLPLSDPEGAWASTWDVGTPLIAILDELKARLPNEGARRWLHFGATTQDAVDTAHMLLTRKSLDLIEVSITGIARSLWRLMQANRDQPQIGRTFLQHARPTSFGLRAASWLETVLRHLKRLRVARSELAVQLGGPVGNRSGYGDESTEIVQALARRLGLGFPILAWHSDRSRVWDVVAQVDQSVRSMAKIATDIVLLVQTDTSEVSVRSGASSSMPGKANPIDAIRVLAAAGACRGAVAMITQERPHELDRGVGSWHLEWFALPLVFQTAAASYEALARLLDSVVVDSEMMRSRLGPDHDGLDSALVDQFETVASLYDDVIGS